MTSHVVHFMDTTYTDTGGYRVYEASRTVVDTGAAALRAWIETEARLNWTVGTLGIDGVAGFRPKIDNVRAGRWAQATLTAPITSGLALQGGAGSGSGGTPYSLTSGRFFFLSLRFGLSSAPRDAPPAGVTPMASSFVALRSSDGALVLRVRAPHARTVEVSGDFDQWTPIRLTPVGRDLWETVLSVAPGTYRVNLRIDGAAWIAPPDTPAVDDEFNGKVGLLVIR
jgi:hypothetical protein